MKAIKLFAMLGLISGIADAATITVSSGLPAQGYTIYVANAPAVNFFVAVGSWNAVTSTYTQFGVSVLDTAKANAVISATGPASLNSSIIDVFVGTGADIASSGANWVIFRSTANTAFPSDVSGVSGITFAATTQAVANFVAKGNIENGFIGTTLNLNLVPEPSAALLGALGALGLLRRRRI